MAFATKQDIGFHYARYNAGQAYRTGEQGEGTHTIAGVVRIAGTPAIARVFLHAADGTLRGYQRTGPDGVYSFIKRQAGEYRLVIEDDRETAHRSKVEHVVVG